MKFIPFILFFVFITFSFSAFSSDEVLIGKSTVTDPNKGREMTYAFSTGKIFIYSRPHPFHFVSALPNDYATYSKKTFRKSQLLNFGMIAGGTLILYAFDDQILQAAKNVGSTFNLAGTSNQTAIIDGKIIIAKQKIPIQFNVPTDINSAMYFLGDGWTHTTIALSFWAAGLISKDNRELQTASQLGEAILTTGIATQLIKHLSGRESPYTTTVPRGVWRFFPNQKVYAAHVPNHDAFPTGHLATAMATVTVIAENYPEKKFIRPLGYSLMGLLGFAMLNNGVHWASDYPLGIAIGYSFAKIAVNRGRVVVDSKNEIQHSMNEQKFKFKPTFFPSYQSGIPGVGVNWLLVKK